jgi:hypothetical protein
MDRYIEQIAGAGYEVVTLNSKQSLLVEKRYAAAVVEKHKSALAGREAFFVVLDIANLDQNKVDPKARRQRVELLLLHTDFSFKTDSINQDVKPSTFPVVMFAGYANVPDEFEAGQKEFHDFLARIEIDGKRGFEPPKPNAPQPDTAPQADADAAPKADADAAPKADVPGVAGSESEDATKPAPPSEPPADQR